MPTTAAAPPPLVAPVDIDTLMLNAGDVSSIMGIANMRSDSELSPNAAADQQDGSDRRDMPGLQRPARTRGQAPVILRTASAHDPVGSAVDVHRIAAQEGHQGQARLAGQVHRQ